MSPSTCSTLKSRRPVCGSCDGRSVIVNGNQHEVPSDVAFDHEREAFDQAGTDTTIIAPDAGHAVWLIGLNPSQQTAGMFSFS